MRRCPSWVTCTSICGHKVPHDRQPDCDTVVCEGRFCEEITYEEEQEYYEDDMS